MKNPFRQFSLDREMRLGILITMLIAAGALACAFGHWIVGSALFGIAAALVAAYWLAVVRPARIPREAIVMIRLSGSIPEEIGRSPIDQIIRRGALSLDSIRDALEAAAKDSAVRAVVLEIAGIE